MATIWHETAIICKCLSNMITDGKSLPVCPDCGYQMMLYELLQWLIAPTTYLLDPDVCVIEGGSS